MRRSYIDWLRGVAVLCMIEWHAIDSWARVDVRDNDTFGWIMFWGGWASPLFLFLAGLSVALGGQAKLKGAAANDPAARRAASWSLQKRGWQIFLYAHLFRIFGLLMSPGSLWSGIFKPDILNILGLGIVTSAWCWGRVSTDGRRSGVRSLAVWVLGPAAAVVLLAPASRVWWWPTLLPSRVEAYVRPVGNLGVFHLFPTVAFVFVGTFVGALIARPRDVAAEPRFHLNLGLAGAAVLAAGWIGAYLPPIPFYSRSEFYTTSISLVLLRIGAMTTALALAWLWFRRPTANHWSPLVLFGRTSLFVYLVHVQIAYGIFSGPLHHALSLPDAIGAFVALTAVMLVAAWAWSKHEKAVWIPERLRADGPDGADGAAGFSRPLTGRAEARPS